ncbi:B-cell differentiation antigen CD72 isoform X2 [Saccopteryx bilineata]|uniref:B-cell differentiation antigen CD72 isoform X2 n=1 Tax=Saccopteryx bilineata TaxID=59482 RepID=UPI00338F8A0A
MAESVTYADLRFVKAPLKKRISSQLGQDLEADDDGELTYENVQVPSTSNLASSGLGDKAGVVSEPPTASWSSVTSPASRQFSACRSACSKYLLLGLLLTCLLLGMAAISLGVRYLQVSQQLQHTNRVLEATNSSLRQQLRLKITQLGQREQDLQGARRELAQSQETLKVQQRDCQAVKEELQVSQASGEETKKALQSEEKERMNLQERLNHMRDTLKPFFTCQSEDSCCPVGWTPMDKSCFHISRIKRSWEQSQNYCQSLSSSLATSYYYYDTSSSLFKVLAQADRSDSYWVDFGWKDWQRTNSKKVSRPNQRCVKVPNGWLQLPSDCTTLLPSVCEMAAFSFQSTTELNTHDNKGL